MTNTCVQLPNPLDKKRKKALYAVGAVARKLGVPSMLCGAFARDVLFWHMHNIEPARRTDDVDISVRLDSWDAYRSLCNVLLNSGFRQRSEQHPEKLVHEATGQEIDLLPFGVIAPDGRTLVWPEDRSSWCVLGLEDAFRQPLWLRIEQHEAGIVLPMVSVPGLALLKLVAIYDRPEDRYKKDGTDIAFVCDNYLAVVGPARLESGPDADLFKAAGGDLLLAAAGLLGRDIGRLCTETTWSHVSDLMKRETESSSWCPVTNGIRHSLKGDFRRARQLLSAIASGLMKGYRHG